MSKPKILFLDIETSPYLIRSWGTYETDALEILEEVRVISFAYRWYGKRTEVHAGDTQSEWQMLSNIKWLLEEADAVVAHNGQQFDMRVINGRMLKYGMLPPKPVRVIDTLKVARRYFKLPSNRLDALGAYLKVGRKLVHTGYNLWKGVLAGDKKAWQTMKRYNRQDVDLLYRVYLKLRPWMGDGHPQLFHHGSCGTCGAAGALNSRGIYRTKTLTKARLCCTRCGTWTSVTVPKPKVSRHAKVPSVRGRHGRTGAPVRRSAA